MTSCAPASRCTPAQCRHLGDEPASTLTRCESRTSPRTCSITWRPSPTSSQRRSWKPILQIECHGSAAEFEIGRKIVGWEQLVPALCELNRASRMNLFVIAGACEGAHLLTALTRAFHSQRGGVFRGRAPVRACWDHFGVVWDRLLLSALTEFYRCVLGTGDSGAACDQRWPRQHRRQHLPQCAQRAEEADRLESSVDRLQSRMGGGRAVVRNRYLDLL